MKRLACFNRWQEAVLLLLLVALLTVAGTMDPAFVSPRVQLKLFDNMWELAILALPMTLIIITAGIDLSMGSTLALSTVTFGLLLSSGCPPWVAAALALAAGTLGGMLNGLLITRLRVHPLIVTLSTLAAYRGVAEGLSKGIPVSPLPASVQALDTSVLGLPVAGWLFMALAAAFAVGLAATPAGRYLYAVGHNEKAARFSGVPVDRMLFRLYALSGFLAAVVALLYASRRNTANPEAGTGYELEVITAVVIGGTSIYGGRGTILGTVLGVLLIHETREFTQWQWSSDELNLTVTGCLLILAVLAHRVLARGQAEESA
jgi:rhamnose transport system permease protein